MEAVFDSLGHVLYTSRGHKGYLIQWKMVAPFAKKWSRNRDPDMDRVHEMVEYHKKGGYIPKIIHLAEITPGLRSNPQSMICDGSPSTNLDNEGMVCYDGNHRKEVFNLCDDDTIMCIIDVMFHATQDNVYEAFCNINKSVQLPAIYIDESCSNENTVKVDIIQTVKGYEQKYRPLLSTSSRCRSPHFNRDLFTDNIYQIYNSFEKVVSIKEIAELLDQLNVEYANGNMGRPHSVYKQSILDKCAKHNMWLFLEKNIPFEHINQVRARTKTKV